MLRACALYNVEHSKLLTRPALTSPANCLIAARCQPETRARPSLPATALHRRAPHHTDRPPPPRCTGGAHAPWSGLPPPPLLPPPPPPPPSTRARCSPLACTPTLARQIFARAPLPSPWRDGTPRRPSFRSFSTRRGSTPPRCISCVRVQMRVARHSRGWAVSAARGRGGTAARARSDRANAGCCEGADRSGEFAVCAAHFFFARVPPGCLSAPLAGRAPIPRPTPRRQTLDKLRNGKRAHTHVYDFGDAFEGRGPRESAAALRANPRPLFLY